MEKWLIDTNVLLRIQDEEPQCSEEALEAVARIAEGGGTACVTPQVLVEFWCAATRPTDVNGLGWDIEAASESMNKILGKYALLEDSPAVFDQWLPLVRNHQRKGKQVHDARLVAVMKAHGVENLLTFNVEDFAAYDEIKTVHPRDVK
jgi:predicted nucleic acid-binding protein